MTVPTDSIQVLHVDDDPSFADLVARYLERESEAITVVTATSAEEGLTYVDEGSVDCVVSDYDMPRTNGLEFLEAVREDDPELPFVLFTGKGSEEIASEAISSGVTDYLQKKGTEQYGLLARRIENAVAQYRAEHRLERTQNKMESLHEKSFELMEATTEDEIWDLAMAAAEGILEFKTCGIYELEDGIFEPRVLENFPEDQQRLRRGEGLIGQAVETGESSMVADVRDSEAAEPLRENFRAVLTVPLGDFGVFQAVSDEPGFFTEQDLELTELLMSHVTQALNTVRYQRDLRAVNERLEAILDNTTAIIYVKDLEGRYTLVNDRYESVLGMDREEILGKTDFEIQSEEYAREVRANDRRAIESESPIEVEERAFRGGEERTYISVKVPMFDEDGDPVAVCGISTDITERTRREEQFKTLHSVAEALDACESRSEVYEILVDGGENVLEYDLAIADAAEGEYLVPKAVSTDAEDAYYDEIPVDAEDRLAARVYRTGEPEITDDLSTEGVDPADERYRSGMTVPIGDHGVFQTVSARPEGFTEEDLEVVETLVSHARTTLDRLERTESLRERTEQLERQNERLDEFASIVSHDLRTPLTIVDGSLDLALDRYDDPDLERADEALDRAFELIDDLLTWAREGERIRARTAVDLAETSRQCWGVVDTGDATLQVVDDVVVKGNAGRIRQLLENLVRNAVEHGTPDPSEEDGRGPITVEVGRTDGGFYVADDGTGFEDADPGTVVEPGYSTSEGGTGFGLSIVDRMAEAHGWEMTITESESGGVRVEFSGVETG